VDGAPTTNARCLPCCGTHAIKLCVCAATPCSLAGYAVVVMAMVAEGWSWSNLITENNLFAVVEQAIWAVLFVTTGTSVAVMLRLVLLASHTRASNGPGLLDP
jgi:hypothetical protein